MLSLDKRREIQRLLRAGYSHAEVARRTGVSLRSVNRIAKEPEVGHSDDAGERRRRGIGRPSKVSDFRQFVLDQLADDPETKTVEILRRAVEHGYEGGRSAMYGLVATVRRELAARDRPSDDAAAQDKLADTEARRRQRDGLPRTKDGPTPNP